MFYTLSQRSHSTQNITQEYRRQHKFTHAFLGHSPALSAVIKGVKVPSYLIYCSSVCKENTAFIGGGKSAQVASSRDKRQQQQQHLRPEHCCRHGKTEGGSKGEHMLEKCWHHVLNFFYSVFSRSSAAVRVDLTTYGMVGSDWSHDRAVAERGKAGAGGMSGV